MLRVCTGLDWQRTTDEKGYLTLGYSSLRKMIEVLSVEGLSYGYDQMVKYRKVAILPLERLVGTNIGLHVLVYIAGRLRKGREIDELIQLAAAGKKLLHGKADGTRGRPGGIAGAWTRGRSDCRPAAVLLQVETISHQPSS